MQIATLAFCLRTTISLALLVANCVWSNVALSSAGKINVLPLDIIRLKTVIIRTLFASFISRCTGFGVTYLE